MLQLIERFEAEDPELRRDCHPVVHAIGRETFRLKGNIHDSFSACDQTCHSGCYHGSVERFLRGDDIYSEGYKHPSQAELKQKATAACDANTPLRLRYQCLHGLGHAILFFAAYQLQSSLDICDALSDDWSRSSCYGGVFMENVSNSANEKKNFSPTDYHAPCNQLADQYRRECYIMQTSRMMEMGLSMERMLQECAKAGAYRVPCAQSIGRDLSNEARMGESRAVAQKCELAEDDNRLACMRGAVYALVDNTWDGRYAMPFCAAFGSNTDREDCFQNEHSIPANRLRKTHRGYRPRLFAPRGQFTALRGIGSPTTNKQRALDLQHLWNFRVEHCYRRRGSFGWHDAQLVLTLFLSAIQRSIELGHSLSHQHGLK